MTRNAVNYRAPSRMTRNELITHYNYRVSVGKMTIAQRNAKLAKYMPQIEEREAKQRTRSYGRSDWLLLTTPLHREQRSVESSQRHFREKGRKDVVALIEDYRLTLCQLDVLFGAARWRDNLTAAQARADMEAMGKPIMNRGHHWIDWAESLWPNKVERIKLDFQRMRQTVHHLRFPFARDK